mmetsp:Transcript_95480/g.164711  ORF Transcript_95480/g.164711 Transcript_95480/m.164711 type:complete len:531 (-) Transcript_95480:353-1945(-)
MQVNAQDQNEQDISERRNNQPPKYHCSYCLTPLNGQRIKCAVCVDFDLCTTCFAVGVEIGGHKKDHCFRLHGEVTEHLLDPEWSIEEEMNLLEGISLCGYGCWEEIAEHVGTLPSKDAEICRIHYIETFLEDPECTAYVNAALADKNPQSSNSRERNRGASSSSASSSSATSSTILGNTKGNKKSTMTCCSVHRSIKQRPEKPQTGTSEYGYNYCRREFDVEKDYELSAESVICKWKGLAQENPVELQAQRALLGVYDRRLCERNRRRNFVETWGLINRKGMLATEKRQRENENWAKWKLVQRALTKEDFMEFIQGFDEEQRLRAEIKAVQHQITERKKHLASVERPEVGDLFMDRPQRLSSACVRKKGPVNNERPALPLSEAEVARCKQLNMPYGQYLMEKDIRIRKWATPSVACLESGQPVPSLAADISSDISSDTPSQGRNQSPCDISEGGKQSDSDISMSSEQSGTPSPELGASIPIGRGPRPKPDLVPRPTADILIPGRGGSDRRLGPGRGLHDIPPSKKPRLKG